MKTNILLVSLMIVCSLCSVQGKAENTISMEDLSVQAGTKQALEINVTNDFIASGFQFNLSLPEGIMIDCDEEDWQTTERSKKFSVSGNFSDGVYKFSVLSLTGKTLLGYDGSVLTLNLSVDPFTHSGEYQMSITDAIIFEDGSAKDYLLDNAYAVIKVDNGPAAIHETMNDDSSEHGAIYTVGGLKLDHTPEQGIVIINGKKVLVK